jgi:release factor glutamine methyltransferase
MNIKQALNANKLLLNKNGLENPEIEAVLILSLAIKKTKEFVLAHQEAKLSLIKILKNKNLARRRAKNTPLAYLAGHKEFYSFDFLVNKNVLTPRPETELMIDEALEIISSLKYPISNIIDVGTGSGCIIITLAKILEKPTTSFNFYGLDISKKALKLARKNANRNNLKNRIHFLYSDLLNSIEKKIFGEPAIILANLPYLSPEQVKESPSIQKEPKIALLAGEDGLSCYRRLFKIIKNNPGLIKKGSFILCEIDERQKTELEKLLKQNLPEAKAETKKDLSGSDRLFIVKL